jgi:3-dehydroquinate synthase class II
LKDFAKAANKKAKEKKALAPLKQSIKRAKDSGASDREVKDTLNKIKKEEGNITTPVAREKFEQEIEKKVNSVESDLDFPSDNDLGELEFVKDLGFYRCKISQG